jgi:hypothetical protein
MKELKELALTDILMLPREQVIFTVQRLGDIKDKFRMFWQKYSSSYVTDTYSTAFFGSLSIDDIFIAPSSNFLDHAVANNDVVNDLVDTINARERLLEQFEAVVLKAIDFRKEEQKQVLAEHKAIKLKPVFKREMIQEFFGIIKDYFSVTDQQQLLELLTTIKDVEHPLILCLER